MENGARIEIKITDKDTGNITKLVKDYNFYPNLGWECEFQASFAETVCQMMDLEEYDLLEDYLYEIRQKEKED